MRPAVPHNEATEHFLHTSRTFPKVTVFSFFAHFYSDYLLLYLYYMSYRLLQKPAAVAVSVAAVAVSVAAVAVAVAAAVAVSVAAVSVSVAAVAVVHSYRQTRPAMLISTVVTAGEGATPYKCKASANTHTHTGARTRTHARTHTVKLFAIQFVVRSYGKLLSVHTHTHTHAHARTHTHTHTHIH